MFFLFQVGIFSFQPLVFEGASWLENKTKQTSWARPTKLPLETSAVLSQSWCNFKPSWSQMHGKQTKAKPLKNKMVVDESWVMVAQKGGLESAKKTSSSVLKQQSSLLFGGKTSTCCKQRFLNFEVSGRAQQ